MEALFKPIKINNLVVPNRIAMAPMTRSMSPNGIPTDQNLEYYKRRAAAEVGMIITEGVEVSHPASSGYPNVPNLRQDSHEGWKKLISCGSRRRFHDILSIVACRRNKKAWATPKS